VTFFSVIAGYHPFAAGGCGVAETRRRILEHDEVVFPPTAEASAECRDIVLRMLEKDPARRATVAALRQHPFLGRRTKLRAERIVRETQITDAASPTTVLSTAPSLAPAASVAVKNPPVADPADILVAVTVTDTEAPAKPQRTTVATGVAADGENPRPGADPDSDAFRSADASTGSISDVPNVAVDGDRGGASPASRTPASPPAVSVAASSGPATPTTIAVPPLSPSPPRSPHDDSTLRLPSFRRFSAVTIAAPPRTDAPSSPPGGARSMSLTEDTLTASVEPLGASGDSALSQSAGDGAMLTAITAAEIASAVTAATVVTTRGTQLLAPPPLIGTPGDPLCPPAASATFPL